MNAQTSTKRLVYTTFLESVMRDHLWTAHIRYEEAIQPPQRRVN